MKLSPPGQPVPSFVPPGGGESVYPRPASYGNFRMSEAWGSPESCYFKYSRVEKPFFSYVLKWSVPWTVAFLYIHLATRLVNLLLTYSFLGQGWQLVAKSQATVRVLQHWSLVVFIVAGVVYCLASTIVANTVEDETLLAVRSLGVQLSRSYCNGHEQNLFINVGRIQDILVNEAFVGHRVVSRLLVAGCRTSGAAGEEGKPDIHVPFDAASPRMHEVVYCWKLVRAVLFLESHHTLTGAHGPTTFNEFSKQQP
eukprot:Protomagalhaensia_sp_Gyna_25__5174@NODE_614_length_3009_cov_64_065657_g476_i0_p2_GENE_NODE_614_length_3009_cov_64_065657_g476_i0NODE_614_length_3009_cov_64_065657_g476_i0_p2_ORF_typecomplete_len254_score11_75PIGH/PF10181_9/3_3e12DUF2842/PF11003_8/1_3e02DUF2842/PF11003_8/1_9_NODE_614_length_3009_cov_64_065657_g476_i0215976